MDKMTPTKITTPKCSILAVYVPDSKSNYILSTARGDLDLVMLGDPNKYITTIPEEYYKRNNGYIEHSIKIIAPISQITEEQAAEIVEKITGTFAGNMQFERQKYFNYLDSALFDTAKESLSALLTANGVDTKEVLILKCK